MKTGFVTDERCFWHDPGNYALMLKPGGYIEPYNRHIENPDPKRRLLNLVQVSGLADQLTRLASRDASVDELLWLHTQRHVAHVQAVANSASVRRFPPMVGTAHCVRRAAAWPRCKP